MFMKIKELAYQALETEAERLIEIVHQVINSVAPAETGKSSEENETGDIAQIDFYFRAEVWKKTIAPRFSNPLFQERVRSFLTNAQATADAIDREGSWDLSTQLFHVRYRMIEIAFRQKKWACLDCEKGGSNLLTSRGPGDISRHHVDRRPKRD